MREEATLGDLTKWASGGTPAKDKPLFWDGDIPWMSAASMHERYYYDSPLKITQEGVKSGSKMALKGTLLLLVRGSMLWNRIPVGIATRDVAFNQDVKALAPTKKILSEFLLQWFMASENMLLHKVVGTGIGAGKLDTDETKSLTVQLPTLPEQQKIADFLTAVDGRIGQLIQKKSLLEDYKKGVMQQLFTQAIRFKDKVNCEARENALGYDHGNDFPDWEEKKIEEMFTVTRGKVLAMPETQSEPSKDFPYPVYSSQTKANGLAGYYDKSLFQDAITWTTDGANAGDVKFRTGEFYCTNVCGVLLSDKGYANEFVASILGTVTRQHVSYVGNPKLMNNVMSKISISVPSAIEEQAKMADFLSAIDRKIESVATQITETQTFKRGLLQQMFV